MIRRRLAELFLELVIDRDVQVAFTRQADTGDLEVPLLLRRAQLTFIDSILLLHLRQRLTQADSQGDRAVVSTDEIMEFLPSMSVPPTRPRRVRETCSCIHREDQEAQHPPENSLE